MTTLDHPDVILSDKRDLIMEAVREVITADTDRATREREAKANASVDRFLPHISRLLESYGTDPRNGITSGPCSDPDHALAWVTTAAGFSFEIVERHSDFPEIEMAGSDCWLLHPLTGERVYRIDYQATWENAARAIHATDQRAEDPFTEPEPPADHPAEALVDALRAFIESMGGRDVGF